MNRKPMMFLAVAGVAGALSAALFVTPRAASAAPAGYDGRGAQGILKPQADGGSARKPAEQEEDEQKVALKDLPSKVVDGVKAAMPDGKITDAEKQKDGTYELDVTSGGKTYEVVVTAEGKVTSKKEEKEEEPAKK